MKSNGMFACVVCVASVALFLTGCSDSEPRASYATYRNPSHIEIIEPAYIEPVEPEPVQDEPSIVEEVPNPETFVSNINDYKEPEQVWPSYDDYGQENHYNDHFASYSEWTSAVASAYSVHTNSGTETASGIPLNDYDCTVASRWLPLYTYIEVSCNGVTVVCQVTDRGPYVDGRDLDLSFGTISALGFYSVDQFGVREVGYRLL